MISINLTSKICANHLTVQKDGEEYTIGDPEQSIYIRIPIEGVLAIELMDGINTLDEISNLLKKNHDVDVDIIDFVETLLELNLIHKFNDEVLVTLKASKDERGGRVKVGRLLFNKFTVFVYLISFVASIIIFTFNPALLPSYQDYFIFNESVGLSLLILFLISWSLTILHESAHYFAASSLGVPVNFKISIRWFWMVIEANMNSLWSIERKKRYLPFLAGMAWDSVILLLALVCQYIYQQDSIIVGYMRLIVLIQIYKFLWHLLIFFRTDLYYVLITITNSSNLLGQAILYLRKIYSKNARIEWSKLRQNEQTLSRIFSFIYLLGIFSAILLFSFFSIPGFLIAVSKAVTNLVNNSWHSLYFWDGTIVIALAFFNLALWIVGAFNRSKELKKAV
ncbi:PqqD family protein [Paenibacillus illinoisensis]|uniref:PqqD family protein n=1 Tax=Paenibacillus illinoisensis TaxID=59845 RepID=UPI000FDAC182|nr:PqqD family protein [Paenibacillus illinoisensis]